MRGSVPPRATSSLIAGSSAVVGSVAMALCGILALRLTGFAFGLSSLAIAEVIRIWLNNVSSLGGAAGLSNVPVLDNVGTIGLVGVAVVLAFSWFLFRRPVGRECDATAVDELLARSVGARPGLVRLLPFAGAPQEIPEPEYALLDGADMLFYATR